MKCITIAVMVAFAGGCLTALAAEQSIIQKNKSFSERLVSIKKGDTILFLNGDSVTHNVMSTTPGNEFNLGSQLPGLATPVTFSAAGEVNVFCAIHPRMQMTVNITD
jgi:plastocyanin